MRASTVDRFWAKVDQTGPCWLWKVGNMKYGMFRGEDGPIAAHLYGYQLENGPIPKGQEVDHLCHNRRCVNPAHMVLVDRGTVMRRAIGTKERKEYCRNGHLRTEENTYVRFGDRSKVCMVCPPTNPN